MTKGHASLVTFSILVLLLLSALALAQEVPSLKPIDQDRILAEVGSLHIKVSVYEDYIGTLRQLIAELQAENAELKEKLKAQ